MVKEMPVSVRAFKVAQTDMCSLFVFLRVSKLRDKGLALAAAVTGNF